MIIMSVDASAFEVLSILVMTVTSTLVTISHTFVRVTKLARWLKHRRAVGGFTHVHHVITDEDISPYNYVGRRAIGLSLLGHSLINVVAVDNLLLLLPMKAHLLLYCHTRA